MSKLTDLIERKNSLIANATQLVQAGLKTSEDKEEYRKTLAAVDSTEEIIAMLKRVEHVIPATAPVVTAPVAKRGNRESKKERRAKLNSAFRAHLQGFREQRDLLTSNDGVAVVPQEFSGYLSETMKLYCPLFNYANVRQTKNARGVKICRVDDSTHGITLLTEGSVTLPDVDPTFSSSVVGSDLFTTGITRFSNQLLTDSDFDLEELLKNLTASRLGRGFEKALTLGTDVAGTALPNNSGLVSLSQTATTTSTIAAGIGWKDIVATYDALDAAYLPKAVWQMSSKTRNYLASLVDGFGRPYFTPNPSGGLDYILSCPIVINQSLPSPTGTTFAANAKPILFGSLFDGFQVVSSEVYVQTLQERFAEFNESALIVSTRVGSASLQAGAIQALKIAAS